MIRIAPTLLLICIAFLVGCASPSGQDKRPLEIFLTEEARPYLSDLTPLLGQRYQIAEAPKSQVKEPRPRLMHSWPLHPLPKAERHFKYLFALVVGPDGTVLDSFLLNASDPSQNKSFFKGVRDWTYKPGLVNGQAKPFLVVTEFEIHFSP